jgi:hypothetical protein
MAYSRERRGDVRDKSTTCGEKGHSEQKTMWPDLRVWSREWEGIA